MKRVVVLLLIFGLLLGLRLDFVSGDNSSYSSSPILKDGKKWRIGYCEYSPYVNYASNLYGLGKGADRTRMALQYGRDSI